MIISATRRADIPAHYSAWFMNRVKAGWCAVPNPFNSRQVTRVSLAPQDVEAVVFWTRDPRPMLVHLGELTAMGFGFVFQFTLLEYPPALHPGMPPLAERLAAFKKLSNSIGPERVLWRYDPIMLTQATGTDFHRSIFESLCRALSGLTQRVTVSLMEPYRKVRKRLVRAGVQLMVPRENDLESMFLDMAAMARSQGMEPLSCADEAGLDRLGFTPGACVDAALLQRLFGLPFPVAKDSSQRPACRCAQSRDIGMYDACPAGCAYCYATQDFTRARQAYARHDPDSPSLLGMPEPAHQQHNLIPG